jgi:hypothetical protein
MKMDQVALFLGIKFCQLLHIIGADSLSDVCRVYQSLKPLSLILGLPTEADLELNPVISPLVVPLKHIGYWILGFILSLGGAAFYSLGRSKNQNDLPNFEPESAQSVDAAPSLLSAETRIRELKHLVDAGLMSVEDFEREKRKLLGI